MTHGGSSSRAKPCPTLTHKFSTMYQMLKQNLMCKHECKRPAAAVAVAVAVAGLLVVVGAAVEQQLAVVVVVVAAAAAAAVASAGCGYS